MSTCTATSCSVPLSNGITLCHDHTTLLEEALREVPGAWQNIYVSACKLDVGAGSVGGMGGEASGSEPANLDALDKAETLHVVLRGRAEQISVISPLLDAPKIAARLFAQLQWIRRRDWAGDFLAELRGALNDCSRSTDRVGEKVFAGTCPTVTTEGACDTALYTRPGRPHSQCPKCQAMWDVSDWRKRALAAAELHTGTAAEISRMLSDPVTGEALPQGTIWSWTSRGKITPSGLTERGKPLYTVSEVRDVWAKMQASSYNRRRNAA